MFQRKTAFFKLGWKFSNTLTHALFLWHLCRLPSYLKRISRFFHPPQLGTYTYPLGTFSTPTPIGTPTFHLEHPPQVQTVVVGWNFKLIVLLCEFKLQFVDPNFSIPAP